MVFNLDLQVAPPVILQYLSVRSEYGYWTRQILDIEGFQSSAGHSSPGARMGTRTGIRTGVSSLYRCYTRSEETEVEDAKERK